MSLKAAELRRLQSSHEKLCKTLGLAAEGRRFTPHVTLARLRGADIGEVQTFIARQNLFHSRPFEVDRFVLFSSRPSRGGGPYGIVESFELNPRPPCRDCRMPPLLSDEATRSLPP